MPDIKLDAAYQELQLAHATLVLTYEAQLAITERLQAEMLRLSADNMRLRENLTALVDALRRVEQARDGAIGALSQPKRAET